MGRRREGETDENLLRLSSPTIALVSQHLHNVMHGCRPLLTLGGVGVGEGEGGNIRGRIGGSETQRVCVDKRGVRTSVGRGEGERGA